MAADLAKLSLWLATLAKDHPFTFLDHSLRHGDALVGLTRKQIASFNWDPSPQQTFLEEKIRHLLELVGQQRREILEARENTPYAQLEQELAVADERLSLPRMIGDAVIAAFFSSEKPKQREVARMRLLACIEADLKKQGFISADGEVDRAIQTLRKGPKGVTPFHWELEFPEVFTSDEEGVTSVGFAAIIGNPPFMGGKRISGALGKGYADWLTTAHQQSNGNADLVAHFFRRAFDLIQENGTSSLIATNTIAQGDTRRSGLRFIGMNRGDIFKAEKRIRWPGVAAVVVSVVSVKKGTYVGSRLLNGQKVEFISAFLIPSGTHQDPSVLRANNNTSFVGCDIKGQGFIFDDNDPDASPLSLKDELFASDPRNSEVIRPYLGGAELNDSPTQSPSRWVISFGQFPEEVARQWPEVFRIVEEKVRPDRRSRSKELAEWPWWQFWRPRRELYDAVSGLKSVLACAQTSRSLAFSFLPSNIVFSHKVIVLALDSYAAFAIVQSTVHLEWAYLFGSTLKDDPVYTPSDCYETFPFPTNWGLSKALIAAGTLYYEARKQLMIKHEEGITSTYNRFHDPNEIDPDIVKLRQLHEVMDRAVLDAYGWTTIQLKSEFIPEFEDGTDEDEEDESGRQRKNRYRYRWPDEVRDDVLARLLELNRQRALEEGQVAMDEKAAALDAKMKKPSNGKRNAKKAKKNPTSGLFAMDQEEA